MDEPPSQAADDVSPAPPVPLPSPVSSPPLLPPLVTVLLPVHNGCTPSPSTLSTAILSILSQSLTSLHLLLIDDASTDATPTLLAHFRSSDLRVSVLTHPTRLGVAAALNSGLAHVPSTSTFVARMDADDVSHPSRLLQQVAVLTQRPQVAVLGCAVDVHSIASSTTRTIALPCTPAMSAWSMPFFCSLAHPSVMFRRALLPSLAYSTCPLHAHVEDLQLWLHLIRTGHALTSLPPPALLTLTRHPHSSSSLHSSHQRHSALHLTRQHLQLILHHRIRWRDVHLLVNPHMICTTAEVLQCGALLLLMERCWISSDGYGVGRGDEAGEDVTKRLGELVMTGMRVRGGKEVEEGEHREDECGVPGCAWEGESEKGAGEQLPEVPSLSVDVNGLMGLWLKRGRGAQSQALLQKLLNSP